MRAPRFALLLFTLAPSPVFAAPLDCHSAALVERAFQTAVVSLHASLQKVLSKKGITLQTLNKSEDGPLATDRAHFQSYYRRIDLEFTTAKGTPMALGCRRWDRKAEEYQDGGAHGVLLVIGKGSPRLEIERDNEGNTVRQSCVAEFGLFSADFSLNGAFGCADGDGDFQVVNTREGSLVDTGAIETSVEVQ